MSVSFAAAFLVAAITVGSPGQTGRSGRVYNPGRIGLAGQVKRVDKPAQGSLAKPLKVAEGAWFQDVTDKSGIPSLKYSEGVNFCCLNDDGLPDLFIPVVKGKDRLYRNMGNFRFKDITDASGINDKGGKDGIGAVFADFNGDGRDDIYIVRGAYPYGENVLYLRKPDGTFRDVSAEAGVVKKKNGISAVAADFSGSGKPDIFVCNWGVNTLFRNISLDGKIKFEDATAKSGLGGEGRSWAAVVSDFFGSGRPDIFVCRGGYGKPESQKLYMNNGDGTFVDKTAGSGIKGIGWSLGAVSADFNNDGLPDLFVTSYDGRDRLYINEGGGRFKDVTETSGINTGHSVGAAAADIDGDGLVDLVVAQFAGPVRIFKNLGGGRFKEIKNSGVGAWSRNEGVALADVDGDGAPDLYVSNYDGHNRLYRNLNGGRRLVVSIKGVRGAGTEARLYETVGGKRSLAAFQELQGVYGFCSQSPEEFLFALPGKKTRYDVEITFPGGGKKILNNVRPGRVEVTGPAKGEN
ncbi:MAG: FG-GAP repeat domain-containing protein [Nitrospirota bacterium]